MSFHNRLLLNRAAIGGLGTIQIMLAVGEGQVAATVRRAEQIGGRVLYTASAVGYLRVEVPTERAVAFVSDNAIDAYQIASLSKSSWLRDGHTEAYARGARAGETRPVGGLVTPSRQLELPALTLERSRDAGYTADDDTGLGEWLKAHPTYDGRGVTIALLETGQAELSHPALRLAKTLEGADVPKLAGILTSLSLDAPDDARVELTAIASCVTTWCRIGDRTYTLPRPGQYRFGLFSLPAAANLVHRFGVLREARSGTVWVDTDGDTDFQDETPVADVNERLDVRVLKLTHPRPMDLNFVVARGRTPDILYVYVSRSGHATMTMSVAAGNKTEESLAYGVAPGARVLLVRNLEGTQYRLHDWVEGYLQAVERADVDVLVSSSGVNPGPDTAADLIGLLFSRMMTTYAKPIFHAAGNRMLVPHSVSSFGTSLSVGGSMGVRTFAALFGGAPIDGLIVHHFGAAGPSFDGMIKPDFIVPTHRISAASWSDPRDRGLPKNAPQAQLPPGYGISCCTSATAPYAAGIAAVLLSAAKQERVAAPLARLSRALRTGARFIDGYPASQQGNGVIDVNAAWRELRNPVEIPVIRTTASIVHPMVQYAARGSEGSGLVEYGGWTAGAIGNRVIQFRRESGPPGATTYRVSWTGNDGAFSGPGTIALPLNETVAFPISVSVGSAGLHDAILNLHDPGTDSIVFRTQAMIVAAASIDPGTGILRLSGSVPLMRKKAHFFNVPPNVAALTVDLEVVRGSASVILVPGNGIFPTGYGHVYPQPRATFVKGRYSVALPRPAAGTWMIDVGNVSAQDEADRTRATTETAEYVAEIRLLNAALDFRPVRSNAGLIGVENLAARLREPAIDVAPGTLRSHSGRFLPTGLPNLIDIEVPPEAATLDVQVRSDAAAGLLELHVYECTTGECFQHDSTFPAAETQRMIVRNPKAGRWVAAVNAAPFPTADSGYVLDEMVAMRGERYVAEGGGTRGAGSRWTRSIQLPPATPQRPGATAIAYAELIDLAVQRDEAERVWQTLDMFPRFRETQRPAAVGTYVHRLNQQPRQ